MSVGKYTPFPYFLTPTLKAYNAPPARVPTPGPPCARIAETRGRAGVYRRTSLHWCPDGCGHFSHRQGKAVGAPGSLFPFEKSSTQGHRGMGRGPLTPIELAGSLCDRTQGSAAEQGLPTAGRDDKRMKGKLGFVLLCPWDCAEESEERKEKGQWSP